MVTCPVSIAFFTSYSDPSVHNDEASRNATLFDEVSHGLLRKTCDRGLAIVVAGWITNGLLIMRSPSVRARVDRTAQGEEGREAACPASTSSSARLEFTMAPRRSSVVFRRPRVTHVTVFPALPRRGFYLGSSGGCTGAVLRLAVRSQNRSMSASTGPDDLSRHDLAVY